MYINGNKKTAVVATGETIKPYMLISVNSSGEASAIGTENTNIHNIKVVMPGFNNDIDEAFTVGDTISYYTPLAGEECYVYVADGTAVTEGALATSDASGGVTDIGAGVEDGLKVLGEFSDSATSDENKVYLRVRS